MSFQVLNPLPRTMRAARFYGVEQPLQIEEVEVPAVGPEDVLIKVEACGLCGTDLQFWHGEIPLPKLPITLGHETSGVIAALGSSVRGWEVGERVVVTGNVPCRTCVKCQEGDFAACVQIYELGIDLDGAFAQYVRTHPVGLARLPDAVPFEIGAMVGDAITTSYHALTERGHLQPGETIVIWGCGGMGLQAIKLARLLQAGCIIAVDIRAGALQKALTFGADKAINAATSRAWEEIQVLTGGADLVLDMVGLADTVTSALRSLRRQGRVVVLGMRAERMKLLPSTLFVWHEYTLTGAFGCKMSEIKDIMKYLVDGRLDLSQSISVRLPLEEINTAIQILDSKQDDPVRVMVLPNA